MSKPHTSGIVVPPEWLETSIVGALGTFSKPSISSPK